MVNTNQTPKVDSQKIRKGEKSIPSQKITSLQRWGKKMKREQ